MNSKPSFDPPLVITNLNHILSPDKMREFPTFTDFVISGGEHCHYLLEESGVKIIYSRNSDQSFVIRKDGVVFSYSSWEEKADSLLKSISCENPLPVCGVIVGNTIINNGDDNDDYEFGESPLTSFGETFGDDYKFVTLSFDTVANLFGMKADGDEQNDTARRVAEAFVNNLVVRDFLKETTTPLTKSQKDAYIEYHRELELQDEKIAPSKKFIKKQEQLAKKFKAPAGFTLGEFGDYFHRPATAIVENPKTKEFGLFGMDENSYFGVLLPRKVSNVGEAFDILIPNEARGLEYIRQGEWFFVSVSEEEQDSLNNEAKTLNVPVVFGVTLPLESHESNPHILAFGTDYTPDIIDSMEDNAIDGDDDAALVRGAFNETHFIVRPLKKSKKDGFKFDMFARYFTCYHIDHKKIENENDKWKRILKNTALRSVSAKRNVD